MRPTDASPSDALQGPELLQHAGFLRAVSRRVLLHPADEDDAVQEAWLAALRSPPRPGPGLKGWFATVVRNHARESHRKERRRGQREERVARDELVPSTADLVQRAETLKRLTAALADLPAPQRDVLLLRYFEDLPPREIARRLGAPVATIKSRHHRALVALRARLDEDDDARGATWRVALMPVAGLAWPQTQTTPRPEAAVWQTALSLVGAAMAVGLVVFAVRRETTAPDRPEPTHLAATTRSGSADAHPTPRPSRPRTQTRVFVYASSYSASMSFSSSFSSRSRNKPAPPEEQESIEALDRRLDEPLPARRFDDAPALDALQFVSHATRLPLEVPAGLAEQLRAHLVHLDTDGRSARDVIEAVLPESRWVAVATPAGLTFRDTPPR